MLKVASKFHFLISRSRQKLFRILRSCIKNKTTKICYTDVNKTRLTLLSFSLRKLFLIFYDSLWCACSSWYVSTQLLAVANSFWFFYSPINHTSDHTFCTHIKLSIITIYRNIETFINYFPKDISRALSHWLKVFYDYTFQTLKRKAWKTT